MRVVALAVLLLLAACHPKASSSDVSSGPAAPDAGTLETGDPKVLPILLTYLRQNERRTEQTAGQDDFHTPEGALLTQNIVRRIRDMPTPDTPQSAEAPDAAEKPAIVPSLNKPKS